jgi:hypothetical protein
MRSSWDQTKSEENTRQKKLYDKYKQTKNPIVKLSENEPLFLLQRRKRREGQGKLCSQQNEESFHNIPTSKLFFFFFFFFWAGLS